MLGSLLVIGGCSDSSSTLDPVEIVETTPPPPPIRVITGSVVDKLSGNVIDGAQVEFLETDVAATNIVDIDGQTISSLTAAGGSFQISTKNGITSFTMVASADGYLSDSVEVSFDAETESLITQVSLVAEATEGVVAVTEETVFEAPITTTTAEITITTEEPVSDEDTTEGSAEVVIPAAVELQDADGNPVAVSTLKVEVTYVEAQEVDDTAPEEEVVTIASVIPEGLNTDAGDAVAETEVLVPIGVAEVNMTNENDVEIKSFSQNITITINLPADTFIPSANRTVIEGDQFTVRSYDQETKLWSTEPNKAIVGPVNADGVYPANLLVDHLTFFALTDGVAVCESPIGFSFSGDAIPTTGLQFSIKSNDIDFVETIGQADSSLSISAFAAKLMGVAANAEASIAVKDFGGKTWYSSGGEVALCGESINVVLANPVVTVDENLDIAQECSNDETVFSAIENAIVTYQLDSNSVQYKAEETSAGSYTLVNLDIAEASYLVSVNTRTDVPNQTLTITPDGTDENLVISVECSVVTGTGSGAN
jgi:hypothetical protein